MLHKYHSQNRPETNWPLSPTFLLPGLHRLKYIIFHPLPLPHWWQFHTTLCSPSIPHNEEIQNSHKKSVLSERLYRTAHPVSALRWLSGELATLLAGRYVEIRVYPLSFAEYLDFTETNDEEAGVPEQENFINYLKYGGLPGIHQMKWEDIRISHQISELCKLKMRFPKVSDNYTLFPYWVSAFDFSENPKLFLPKKYFRYYPSGIAQYFPEEPCPWPDFF